MSVQKKGVKSTPRKNRNNNSTNSITESRTRNYATVLYPESMSSDALQKLNDMHISYLLSPLHDKDINPTGEAKKPHYHLIVVYDSVKTMKQAKEVFDSLGGVGCEAINAIRGYARYLCHLDNPEKAQYPIEQVKAHILDYQSIIGLASDKYQAIKEMMEFCDKYQVLAFSTLCRYAREHRNDWFRILCDCGSVAMKEYLKSKFWTDGNVELETIVDPATGEKLL